MIIVNRAIKQSIHEKIEIPMNNTISGITSGVALPMMSKTRMAVNQRNLLNVIRDNFKENSQSNLRIF